MWLPNLAVRTPRAVGDHALSAESAPRGAGLIPCRCGDRGEVFASDVIMAIKDAAVAELDDMPTLLERCQPGDAVTLTVWRPGPQRKQPVVLGNSE